LAQLPYPYNTGVISQFLPRFNSAVTRDRIKAEQWPGGCSEPGTFYVQYANNAFWQGLANWSIGVCMPGKQSQIPWKSTRSRQDFTEELYMNISIVGLVGNLAANPDDSESTGGMFRIAASTTAGESLSTVVYTGCMSKKADYSRVLRAAKLHEQPDAGSAH
jgi:hypothetical protein